MPRRISFAATVLLLAAAVLTAGSPQNTPRAASAPFRNVRGIIVADNADARPLRRVRVDVTGGSIVASPSYSDDYGRFEVLVPASAAYALTFTKAGSAFHVTAPAAAVPAEAIFESRLPPAPL